MRLSGKKDSTIHGPELNRSYFTDKPEREDGPLTNSRSSIRSPSPSADGSCFLSAFFPSSSTVSCAFSDPHHGAANKASLGAANKAANKAAHGAALTSTH